MSSQESKIHNIVVNWTKVEVESSASEGDLLCWALEHCKSKFYNRGANWFFHSSRDAVMFQLKFSTFILKNIVSEMA